MSRHVCAVCEQPIDIAHQAAIRFSTELAGPAAKRFHYSGAAAISAIGAGFTSVIRAAMAGQTPHVYWFHTSCWDTFSADLLVSSDG